MNTERESTFYHSLASEAASVERKTNEQGISKQRLAKLLCDAGETWAAAAAHSRQPDRCHAQHRYEFCRGALVRMGRADLVAQLETYHAGF